MKPRLRQSKKQTLNNAKKLRRRRKKKSYLFQQPLILQANMNEDAKVEEEGEVEYFEDYHGRLSRSRELSDGLVQPGPTKH